MTKTTRDHGAPVKMHRIAGAAFAGSAIEFYDFFIFGTATALVFGQLFFSEFGGGRGTLALAATYAVAFVARPVGSIVFGHIGDRVGRKKTLVSTLLLMGLSTFAIGLIPSYGAIGWAAPAILVALRFLQGLAVGGEWAGAALLTAEFAPPNKRGRYGMFPQLGPAAALALSAATFLVVFALTGNPTTSDAFQSWGWRIPFLASIVLVAVGLYIRLEIEETPAFAEILERRAPVKSPVRDAVRAQWREILLAGGALAGLFGFFYIGTVFLTGYAGKNPKGVPPGVLGLSTQSILWIHVLAAAAFAVTTALSAVYSDRIGRRTVVLGANVVAVPLGLVVFQIVDSGGRAGLAWGMCLMLGLVGVAYGPCAAFLPEMFATRYRYTGAGLGYNLGGVLGGAIPIVFAHHLLAEYGSYAIGLYLAGLALLSSVCLWRLAETREAAAGPAATAELPREDAAQALAASLTR
ncbi:MAG: MFS transporter [Sporichthyaceae bacterium]